MTDIEKGINDINKQIEEAPLSKWETRETNL